MPTDAHDSAVNTERLRRRRRLTARSAADDTRCGLADLYQKYQRSLVRLVRPLVDTRESAEEVVNDVFVRLLARDEMPSVNPAAYLRTAAVNAARSELRRRQVARRHLTSIIAQAPQAKDDASEGGIALLQLQQALTGVALLAPRQRDVITLRYVDGLSEQQTAARLGISVGSVKTHASRGIRALRSEWIRPEFAA